MRNIKLLCISLLCLFHYNTAHADFLPPVTGLALQGDQLSWDAQDVADGYNVYLNYTYFDTVRDTLTYTVTEPGDYHVISFNDNGVFGVTRDPSMTGGPFPFVTFAGGEAFESVSYDYQNQTLLTYNTCKDVSPGESCIARCPVSFDPPFGGTRFVAYMSGGACSTSDIVEADAFISPLTYRCTVPKFSGEVVAQAICVFHER